MKIESRRNPSLRRSRGERVYVGMSGGVDSSLSAALLVEAGHDVTGVYMKNWTADLPGMKCPWAEDLADAKRVAVQLGIQFKVFDFQDQYKHLVVDYMIAEYSAGRTPNPDIMCNQEVKFKLFLDAALADGADAIATGHYARAQRNIFSSSTCSQKCHTLDGQQNRPEGRTCLCRQEYTFLTHKSGDDSEKSRTTARLLRARDLNKDQTYFLYRVTAEALSKTIFPLGDFTSKAEVREEAEKRELTTARKRDSQGICFVGNVGIREFLSQFVETKLGAIVERETDKTIGQHDGAIFYTFGQRHGLSVGGGLPYYVVGKDMTKNEVYVSTNLNSENFWRHEIYLTDIHWINEAPSSNQTYQIRVRHRAPLVDAAIDGDVVRLSNPERAVAPGQSIVIYDDEIVMGGGIVQ